MLVLSRKINEAILIADNIRVTVVAIRGNQVRIGIEAPPEVPVFREEVLNPASAHAEADANSRRSTPLVDRLAAR